MKAAFSPKQVELCRLFVNHDVVIASGSVSSGKTAVCWVCFRSWLASNYAGEHVAVCVRTARQFNNPILKEDSLWFPDEPLRRSGDVWVAPSWLPGGEPNRVHRLIGGDAASAAKVQGSTFRAAFIDEAPKMPEDFLTMVYSRVRRPGERKLLLTCNPEGPHHPFKTDWIDRASELGYAYLQFGLDDNPILDEEYKEGVARQFTGIMHARMVLGQWAAATGLVYPSFSRAIGQAPNAAKETPVRYDAAVDVGSSGVTHGLLVATYRNPLRRWVLDEWRWDGSEEGQMPDESQIRRMIRRWQAYRIRTWIIDPAANAFSLILQQMGLATVHGYNQLLPGIQVTDTWLADGRLRVDRSCKQLIREAANYQWDEKYAEKGEDRPMKVRDHGVDALRYACATLARQPAVTTTRIIR